MISTDDLERMVVEIMTGQSPSLEGDEAAQVRAKLQQECDDIQKNGGMVDLPAEIPDSIEILNKALSQEDDLDKFGTALLMKAIAAGLYDN